MVAAGTLTSCRKAVEIRYRLTVNILDSGVPRTGSAVWSLTLTQGLQGGYDARLLGEAVAIDLGPRGRLFVLLAGRTADGLPTSFDDMALLPEALFGDVGRGRVGQLPLHRSRIDDLISIKARQGATRALDCRQPQRYFDQCPFMVRFGNPGDVTTVIPVDPLDLASSFGPGVKLSGIHVTITDDQVGSSGRSLLPDYRNKPTFSRWFAALPIDDPRRVGPENFRLGDKQ